MRKLVRAHHVAASFLLLLSSSCLVLSGDFAEGECSPRSTESCYDGALATMNVGECSSGTRTCSDDGQWSACEGQVLPKPEDCSKTGDEDCDGTGCSDLVSAQFFEDIGANLVFKGDCSGVGWRSDGDIVMGGSFGGSINFGVGPLISSGQGFFLPGDGFVVDFHANGTAAWDTHYPNATQPSFAVADDEVFFADMKDPQTMGLRLLVDRLSPTTAIAWSHTFGDSSSFFSPASVALDPAGDLLVAGTFRGDLDFGVKTLSSENEAAFIGKLDGKTGKPVWIREITGPGNDHVNALVAADASGNLVVGGTFDNALTFPTTDLTASQPGQPTLFIARFDASGAFAWARQIHGGSTNLSNIAIDSMGNAVLTGYFKNDLGGVLRASTSDDSLFVAQINPLGFTRWLRGAVQTDDVRVSALAIDAEDNIVLSGVSYGSLDLGTGAFTSKSVWTFLAKFDKSSAALWVKAWTAPGPLFLPGALAIDPATKRIALCGNLSGELDLGMGLVGKRNAMGVLLAVFEP